MTLQRKTGGFTLIEVMIAVAIIGILVAVALPSYRNYVIRGKLVAGTNALSTMRAAMEQYYQDNRTYAAITTPTAQTPPCALNPVTASNSQPFNVNCSATTDVPTATTYTLRATGTGSVNNAVYTIDQTGAMKTVSYPTAWGGTANLPANNGCWLMRQGDSC